MKSSNTSEMSIYPESRNGSEGESIRSNKSISKSISEVMGFNSKSKKKSKLEQEEFTESEYDDSNDDNEDKFTLNDEHNWCKEPVTEYAFNLPLVRKNLDRLICTDIVQLTNHKFMKDLRKRVWKDFDESLNEKVKQREVQEIERTKKLILKCRYNSSNCPRKLIPLHSAVLALDVGAETTPNIARDTRRPDEYDGPVFNINRRTNISIRARRMKLKSIRKRNFDYLMRQLRKEGNAVKLEYDQLREIQENIKNIRNSIMETKAKKSKYLNFVTKLVKKVKSIIVSKKETNKSDNREHSMQAYRQGVISKQTQVNKKNLQLFKNSKTKQAPKVSKSSKHSEAPKELTTTSLITKDTRKLIKSQSKVSFEKVK